MIGKKPEPCREEKEVEEGFFRKKRKPYRWMSEAVGGEVEVAPNSRKKI